MSDTQNCPMSRACRPCWTGTLPEEAQAAMATHLESCDHCRRQLELLAGGNVVLPQDPAASEHRSPALEQAMMRLKGELLRGDADGGRDPWCPAVLWFPKPV